MSLISAVGVAFIAAHQKRDERERKARQKRQDKIEHDRQLRDELQIDLIATAMELSLISAKKLTNMKTNGEVEEALCNAACAQQTYKKFCEKAVQNI